MGKDIGNIAKTDIRYAVLFPSLPAFVLLLFFLPRFFFLPDCFFKSFFTA